MYEDVLVLGLDEEGALVADVAEVGLDVDLALGAELPQHRVNHDVGARAPHARAAVHNNLGGDNILGRRKYFWIASNIFLPGHCPAPLRTRRRTS